MLRLLEGDIWLFVNDCYIVIFCSNGRKEGGVEMVVGSVDVMVRIIKKHTLVTWRFFFLWIEGTSRGGLAGEDASIRGPIDCIHFTDLEGGFITLFECEIRSQ